jgi:hypothetical protein
MGTGTSGQTTKRKYRKPNQMSYKSKETWTTPSTAQHKSSPNGSTQKGKKIITPFRT